MQVFIYLFQKLPIVLQKTINWLSVNVSKNKSLTHIPLNSSKCDQTTLVIFNTCSTFRLLKPLRKVSLKIKKKNCIGRYHIYKTITIFHRKVLLNIIIIKQSKKEYQ